MTGTLREWVMGLSAAALVCAIAMELTPKGAVKGVLRMVCGMVLAAALLGPLLRLDLEDYALRLSQSRETAARVVGAAEETAARLDRRSIERELEAYCLEEAERRGAALSGVTVTLRWSTEGVWVPETVALDGAYDAGLSAWLTAELGVGPAAQTWRTDEEAEP